ncbi:MAG: hypothetical protein E6J60_04710, partial [Deltaproteobacteria bacterium]
MPPCTPCCFNVNDVFVRDRCVAHGVPVPGCTPTTERVSIGSDGTQGNFKSFQPSISADGRYVAFTSATNFDNGMPCLVFGLPCGLVFVHDRCVAAGMPVRACTPTTERVSVAPDGTTFNDATSQNPSISADGQLVAFFAIEVPIHSPFAGFFACSSTVDAILVRDRRRGLTECIN